MGEYKGIPGHKTQKHRGTVEEAHTRPETLHGYKTKQKESEVPTKTHAGKSAPTPANAAPGDPQ